MNCLSWAIPREMRERTVSPFLRQYPIALSLFRANHMVGHNWHTVKQRASTRLTFFWKFAFPGLFAIPFGCAAVILLLRQSWMALPFAAAALFFGSMYLWFSPRYMAIAFDDQFLYLSDASREIKIPWCQVEHIHRWIMSRWPTYSISFHEPTEFGRKVF